MLPLVSKQKVPKSTVQMAPALRLQTSPPVYVIVISGGWLLKHTTPSWRIKDPMKGFQRIVKEDRAKQIARTVLDRERAFPNAITLATNIKSLKESGSEIILPAKIKFLVVDGQHRLWAQKFSEKDGRYACIIHLNKTEREMAELFLEINDNQRRVPSSLRWDLVRLVRPAGDEAGVMAAELVYELANREDSPFYIAIDLTGEQKDVSIKQGSLAPEIKTLVGRVKKAKTAGDPPFEEYASLLIRFFSAVRSLDPQGWGDPSSTYYKARVLRALIRVLVDIVLNAGSLDELSADILLRELQKIDPATLSEDRLRAAQGSAGVTDLYQAMRNQVFPNATV
jgi:DGQHR domain-containing protein